MFLGILGDYCLMLELVLAYYCFFLKYHQVGHILLLFLRPCKLSILKIRLWVGYKKKGNC